MEMSQKEKHIIAYFSMWLNKDFGNIENVFAPDIHYSEYHGPVCRGIDELRHWLNTKHQPLEWSVLQTIRQRDMMVVEWFCKDATHGEYAELNGVSLIKFRQDGRICSIKEFASFAGRQDDWGVVIKGGLG